MHGHIIITHITKTSSVTSTANCRLYYAHKDLPLGTFRQCETQAPDTSFAYFVKSVLYMSLVDLILINLFNNK